MRRLTRRCSELGMRVNPADFKALNLRCHALLNDVPLHDVWGIPLYGRGPVARPGGSCDLVRRSAPIY
jgi:hypothetical protein